MRPQLLPQFFHKFTTTIALALITFFIVGCETEEAIIAKWQPILVDEAQEGEFTIEVDPADMSINAFSNYQTHVITVTEGMLEAGFTQAQLLLVLCHEIGHQNHLGHSVNIDPYFNEDFADAYGLFLLQEIDEDYHLNIDFYEAIKMFYKLPGGKNSGDDGIHHSNDYRYRALKHQLDIQVAHKGEVEPGFSSKSV